MQFCWKNDLFIDEGTWNWTVSVCAHFVCAYVLLLLLLLLLCVCSFAIFNLHN